MILSTSFGTLSLKTVPSFRIPVNFCFTATGTVTSPSSLNLLVFHQLVWETFFFNSSLHLSLSLFVLWTWKIKICSCTGIKVWFSYQNCLKNKCFWILPNLMSFIELLNSIVAWQSQYWANFFSFLGMGDIHGNSTGTKNFVPMIQDNLVLPPLMLMLSVRMLPIFRLTVRLNQLIFRWLWYFSLWQMGWNNITFWKSNFKHFPGQSNYSAPFICVLF